MANQIGPDDLKACEWFRTKKAARGIANIFTYREYNRHSKNR